ncbi:non-ribosomal peptide synthetase [Propionibacterium acidifaciens]|uniref:non-ribosomal peptide synthetase n=2 Tax=Propionibacterium acidifaciens TaxID=556499 RepID=UPI0030B901C2
MELKEIEHAISTHPEVMEVAVVASEGRTRQMYAAVVTRPGARLTVDELVGWQEQQIPWPCTLLSFFDELPLNRNGKVDREAVLARLMAEYPDGGPIAGSPLGPLEAAVAAYWYEYLSVPVRSADDDFFLLGGDSLIASRVIAAMRREGWTTSLAEVFTHPRLGDYAKTCVPPQGIREDQASALAHDADHAYEPFGLTEVQRAYLVGRDPELTLGGVDCIFYREYRVEEVDEQRLGRAIDTVVARHPMLRTVFEGTSQRVLAEVGPYRVVRSAGAEAERMRRELSGRAFEPDRWPLFDVRVLEFDGSPHICVTTDSIVMDAASVLIFQREVDAAYAGHELEAPPEIDFRDYVVGYLEDEALSGERRSAALTYWREHARELPPSPALPLARSPEELGVPGIERRTIQIDAGQWELLRERCRREAVTPSVLVLASFCEAMRAFSGQSAVSVAVTVFDRPEVHPQIDRVLGDFTSLVVAAYRASGEQDWATRVKDVSHELAHDLENFSVGMGAIGRLAQEAGATSAFPVVFTSALGIEQTFGGDRGLFRECTGGTSATPQVWLDHQISDDGQGGVRINWDHVVGLFPEGLIESAMAHQKALLDFASEQSWDTSPPAAITERERETRRCFEEPAETEPRLLHADLVALARTVPDEPALVGPDGRILSRGALMDRASRVCAVLSHEGVGAGEQVMIRLSDPVSRVAAIYGVLMAGGSYVPVSADHPRRRVDSIIAQTGLRTVIDDDWMLRLEGSAGPTATSWGPGPARPEDPAYTIFTSGSTGEPKGVVLSHEAAAATIDAVHARWKPREGWRGLAVSAVDFDLSVFDLFGCLGSGGLLVLVGEQHRRDSQSWARLVREHQVNYWNTVPTLLEMLLVSAGPGDLTSLRPVLVSGDRVPLDLDSRLIEASPRAMLVALGGATECAIWSNWFEPTGDESWRQQSPAWDSVPYGHPLPGQRFDVLTAEGEPCPDWVVGELTISGCGVAEGYVGEDQGGFRVDSAGRRSYRTGDLGRFRPGGLLEILGRLDDQVKVRGHRIATGEVEAAAESLPGIERAVAGVIEGEDGAILALACVPTTAALRGETGRVEVDPVHAEGSPSHFGLPARAIRVAAVLREVISRTHRDDGTLRVLEFWEAWLAGQEIGRLLVEDIPVVELLADVLARRRPLADLGTERATDVMAQMNDQEESACALEWMLRSARKIIDGSSASYVGLWASTAVAHELAGRIGGIEADRDHLVPTGESEVWAGRGFDLVLAPFSMHTFARPERAMRRAVRALRPGGHLVMTEIGRLAPEALLSAVLLEDGFGPDGSRASDPMRGHCHDHDEWAELAVRFGLRPTAAISVEGSTVYGLVLQRPGEDEELDGERLRAQLAERLAAPYVPRLCEIIDAVPMTRNGKVDRMTVMAALRVGGAGALGGGEAPGAGLESLVAECWQSLLGASGISRTDSLFDHGGDSLSAARLVVELERRTGVRLSLRRILESPTVQGIAESLAIAGADDNGEGFEEGEL